jgi:hypothetical protein
MEEIHSFHEAIKKDSEQKFKIAMKYFASMNSNDKHAYNEEKKSAVAVALSSGRFDVYRILILNGFSLGPLESFEDFQPYLNYVDSLHENIRKGDIGKVQEIIENLPFETV